METNSIHFKATFCFEMATTKAFLTGGFLFMSSFLGFVTGFKQILIWYKYVKTAEDRRKPSSHPHIVFVLAVCNIISCASLLFVALGFVILHYTKGMKKNGLHIASASMIAWILPMEVLVTLGFVSSGYFTMIYIIDVCLQVIQNKSFLKAYHAVAWTASVTTSAVIFVLRYGHGNIRICKTHKEIIPLVMCWQCLLLGLILVSVIGLYLFDKQVKADLYRLGNAYTQSERTLLQRIRLKFALLVVIFVVCWTPTIAIGFLTLLDAQTPTVDILLFLEVTLNPLQPSLNYFIFIPAIQSKSVVPPQSERNGCVANIQDIYGESLGSSLWGSTGFQTSRNIRVNASSPHFHFTPRSLTSAEQEPLLQSQISSAGRYSYTTTSSDMDDNSLIIGKLLGE